MLTIAKLFGKSPFAPLQTHMNRVASCIEKLSKLFEALSKQEFDKVERLAHEISDLEHQADVTKNDIRNHLPKSVFLPMDRGHFLNILSIQDSIADLAESIGFLLVLRPKELCASACVDLQGLYKKNIHVFWDAKQVIAEIDELLESSFGGIEAEKVKSMVEQVAHKEHEASRTQHSCMQQLFTKNTPQEPALFYLWIKLIEEVSEISHLSEKLANRIRMVLELK